MTSVAAVAIFIETADKWKGAFTSEDEEAGWAGGTL